MNAKFTALIAAMCLSAGAFAQTHPSTSGTSNTGTPTAGQSTANSGEQAATAMQNNTNTQNTKTPATAKHGKTSKATKAKTGDCTVQTDGHTTTPAGSGELAMGTANCNNTNPRNVTR